MNCDRRVMDFDGGAMSFYSMVIGLLIKFVVSLGRFKLQIGESLLIPQTEGFP